VLKQWQYDIELHYYQVLVFLVPNIPMMLGLVYGFILLDERDAGIITSISVTPLGKQGYLKLRLIIPFLVSFLALWLVCYLSNLHSYLEAWKVAAFVFLVNLNAPVMLLLLGALAGNKIEGIALSKSFGLLLMAILPIYLFDNWIHWIGGFSPLFWYAKAVFSPSPGYFILFCLAGTLLQSVIIWFLYVRFIRKIG
ncbi:MAG: hypothetical protein MI922_27890, partial [Bacteroidales bacterium]|nr:hypothetical protein [Bacteroidales bacterium]